MSGCLPGWSVFLSAWPCVHWKLTRQQCPIIYTTSVMRKRHRPREGRPLRAYASLKTAYYTHKHKTPHINTHTSIHTHMLKDGFPLITECVKTKLWLTQHTQFKQIPPHPQERNLNKVWYTQHIDTSAVDEEPAHEESTSHTLSKNKHDRRRSFSPRQGGRINTPERSFLCNMEVVWIQKVRRLRFVKCVKNSYQQGVETQPKRFYIYMEMSVLL